jgi:hypothetical protein
MHTADLITGNRMVACCDILGFKKLVKSKPALELVHGELARFHELLIFCLTQKWEDRKDLAQLRRLLRGQKRVGIAWFSDTYLIYGIDDDEDSCYNVIVTVAWLLGVTIQTSTPVRAGVAYGEFSRCPKNELYVGKALVEAYEWEQCQEWVGGALSPTAAKKSPRDKQGQKEWGLKLYDKVPLKTKTAASSSYPTKECEGCEKLPKTQFAVSPWFKTLALDWTWIDHDRETCDRQIELAKLCARDAANDGNRERAQSIVRKWENTSRFHVETCDSCFPGNKQREHHTTR